MPTQNKKWRWCLSQGAVIVLAVVLLLPGVKAGLIADDFWHALWVTQRAENPAASPSSPFGLFAFIDTSDAVRDGLISKGALPWWAADDLKVKFWRPVAELTHLDYRWFYNTPVMLHVHSLLWYVALLCLAAAYYRRILGQQRLVLFALLFLIAEPFHAITVTWLANRNIIIAAVFALACLILHYDFRQSGKRWQHYLAVVCLLLSLLASEAGISAFAFLIAFAVCLDKKPAAVKSVLPYAALIIIWFFGYKLMGYGAAGSGQMYVDPLANPATYLVQFFQRIPQMLMLQVSVFPKLFPDTWTSSWLTAGGLLLMAIFAGVLYYSKNRILLFCALALLGSSVPLASALLHERNFTFISLAISPVLALLLDYCWRNGIAGSAVISKSLFALLFTVRIVLCALLVPLACWYIMYANHTIIKTANSVEDIAVDQRHIITLGMPVMHSTFFYPVRALNAAVLPLSHLNLASDQSGLIISRESDNQWLLEAEYGLLSGEDLFLRDIESAPFLAGEQYTAAAINIEILSVNDLGNPLALRINLPDENGRNYQFFYWQDNALHLLNMERGDFQQMPGVN